MDHSDLTTWIPLDRQNSTQLPWLSLIMLGNRVGRAVLEANTATILAHKTLTGRINACFNDLKHLGTFRSC